LSDAEKLTHDRTVKNKAVLNDDGRIACDDEGITIRWYYLWGAKRIPSRAIRSAKTLPLKPIRGKWRVWGSGDLVHWVQPLLLISWKVSHALTTSRVPNFVS
jgi:hypothetical protein